MDNSDKPQRFSLDNVTYTLIVVFILLLFGTVTYRAISDARRDGQRSAVLTPYVGPLTDADHAIIAQATDILARAEASQSSAERILNFLEGASILIGGAAAVAAIYGYRNTQETRNELEKKLAELTDLRKTLQEELQREQKSAEARTEAHFDRETRRLIDDEQQLKHTIHDEIARIRTEHAAFNDRFTALSERNMRAAAELEKAQPFLNQLPAQLADLARHQETISEAKDQIIHLEQLSTDINTRVENLMLALSDLIQANQALLLRNHDEAYNEVLGVLKQMPENVLALYMAGWIEFQYIPDKFESGLARMERAYELAPENPTIMAAYGIVLRRKAVQHDGDQRTRFFAKAEGLLLEALHINPRLLDLNQESFWGPVAGLRRDQGRLEAAIEAYENAVAVTPGSSYPRGNLAALYLCQHHASGDRESLKKALHNFKQTLVYAQHELATFANDYFHLMDIAMARMILGRIRPNYLEEAHTQLDDVLMINPSVEMLQTSRRGWYFLYNATPDSWGNVRAALWKAIEKIEVKIIEQNETPLKIETTPLCG